MSNIKMSDIKMSEEFYLPLTHKNGVVEDDSGLFVADLASTEMDVAMCHAINTHDTLVAQNLALKAALEKIKAEQELERSDAGHSGYSETWLISSNALLALEGAGDEQG